MNEEPFTPKGGTATEAHPGAPHVSGTPLQQKTGQAAQSFQSEAERLKSSAREQSAAAMDQMKEGLHSATHQAKEAGRTFIHNQQGTIAARLSEYAGAARAASERLHGGESNMLARPAERAAEGLERLSSYLQNHEPADLMDDLERFARRRPEVVFGGLFVAGLAAARFLKASRRSLDERQRAGAIVPTTGPGAPAPVHLGPTPSVGSTTERPFATGTPSTMGATAPTTSPATSSIPPVTGTSTTPTVPPLPSGVKPPGGPSTGGTSTGSTSSSPTKPMP